MRYSNNYRNPNYKTYAERQRELEAEHARRENAARKQFEKLIAGIDDAINLCKIELCDDGRIKFNNEAFKDDVWVWRLVKDYILANKKSIVERLGGVYQEPKQDPVVAWFASYEPLKQYRRAESDWEEYRSRENRAHEGAAGESNAYLFVKKPELQTPGEMLKNNAELDAVVTMDDARRQYRFEAIAKKAFEKIANGAPILEVYEAYKQDAAPIFEAERKDLERRMWD